MREAEFNIKISGDGQSILTGIQGIVELATAFGTCSVPPSTVSYGVRGQRCTRPAPADVTPVIGWTQTLLGGPPVAPTLGPALAEKIRQRGGEVGPAPSSPPLPEAELSIRPLEARAGSNLTLVVKITNKGKGPLYRFQGKTRSADPALDGHLFYLGKIDAGQSAEDTLVVQIPRDQRDVEVPMRIEFEEHNGFVPYPLEAMIALKGLPRPRFAYTYQIIDDASGKTLVAVGTKDKEVQGNVKYGGNKAAAQTIGKLLAEKAVAAGIIGCGHDAVKLGEIVRQGQGPSDHAREGWAFPRPLPDL